MLDSLLQDLRYAFRALRSSPGFALVAILSLALGIGANTAIFSLIDTLILKTLPVENPAELVQVNMGTDDTSFTNPIWEQVRDRQDVFRGVFAFGGARLTWRRVARRAMRKAIGSAEISSRHWAFARLLGALSRRTTIAAAARGRRCSPMISGSVNTADAPMYSTSRSRSIIIASR